ncbi:Uncharacterised protein [uncultured archaeon]|nr:Uncharacterised protein [uncultured archaeon]
MSSSFLYKGLLSGKAFSVALIAFFMAFFCFPVFGDSPAFSTIPELRVSQTAGPTINAVDLWQYASDAEDTDANLTFSMSQSDSTLINCYIQNDASSKNRYIGCSSPSPGRTGINTITARAIDTNGQSATATFNAVIFADVNPNTSPAISGLPDLAFRDDVGTQARLIDLHNYASDSQSPKEQLTFTRAQSNPGLINCFIEGGRYFSCDAPQRNGSGTSTITIEARDPQGATASDSFTVTIYRSGHYGDYYNGDYYDNHYYDDYYGNGSAPSLSGLPDISIGMNARYRSGLIDLWANAYDSEDNPEDLRYTVESQSNTSLIFCRITDNRYFECEAPARDREGISEVTIMARDRSNRTDSETIEVRVGDNGGNYGSCANLDVSTRTIYMSGNETKRVSFDVHNNARRDMRIRNVEVSGDNSPYFSARLVDYDSYINSGSYGNIEMELSSNNYSGYREATVYIDISGESASTSGSYYNDYYNDYGHYNGSYCSNGTRTESFKVVISGYSSGSYGTCGETRLSASDIEVPEKSRQEQRVTIRNNSYRDFQVDTVIVNESNIYFSASVDSRPSVVPANGSADIILSINSDAVSGNKSGNVNVSVAGRYSNGNYCSTAAIYRDFKVTVKDTSAGYGSGYGTGNDGQAAEDIDISFSDSFVQLEQGQSKNVKAAITNNTYSRKCIGLEVTGGRAFDASISKTNACIDAGTSMDATITIKANTPGSGSAELKAAYGNASKSKFISVEVRESQAKLDFAVTSKESQEGKATLIVENTGSDLTNAKITVESPDSRVQFEDVIKGFWKNGEQVTIEGKAYGNAIVTGNVKVSSALGDKSAPFELEIKGQGQDINAGQTGLAGLATTAAMAVALVAILGLAVVGIMSIIGR